MNEVEINYAFTEIIINELNERAFDLGDWETKIAQCESPEDVKTIIMAECTHFDISEVGSLRPCILTEFGKRVDWDRVTNYLIEKYVQEGGKLPFQHNNSL
ncbi:hypothetical protein HNP86_000978 [Methanococcus maripaludis]|uniref:Uncharacterized protein n=1 Tax=Methanococcus maripaludis TaxID=39152 RepID=A0A7J9NU48_METMI|nr:hypothetical protein [Methanococcus maripaludis]MBA2850847.1 hypothetical protein [Methanococcus maripaludis]